LQNRDRVEFYCSDKLVVAVNSSIVPRKSEFISIRGVVYKVIRVTYAVDYADRIHERLMRANVEMRKEK